MNTQPGERQQTSRNRDCDSWTPEQQGKGPEAKNFSY